MARVSAGKSDFTIGNDHIIRQHGRRCPCTFGLPGMVPFQCCIRDDERMELAAVWEQARPGHHRHVTRRRQCSCRTQPASFPIPSRCRLIRAMLQSGPDLPPTLEHDDDWWKHRIAVLCRAGVGLTLCKPKTMGQNLSGNRAARLETARPED